MKDWDLEPESDASDAPPHASRRRVSRRAAMAMFVSGLVAGVVIAGLNVAGAQTPTPTPSAPSLPKIERHALGHHGKGFGFGMGGIHGEFTTKAPGGGYQTLASQIGEVTSVSASSITVKSEDGYSRTYSVDDNTLVNAGNEGIADVKKGDNVRVTAVVSGGKARAVDIADMTQAGALRDKWLPQLRPPKSG